MKNKTLRHTVYAAACLALAFVLPFITANNQQLGNALSLMHIPVLLCGFICGWPWGLAVGAIAPILRSLIIGMPPMMPIAFAMAFELAAYGFVAGLLYKLLPKKIPYIYVSLIGAMIVGRLVGGCVKFILAGFGKGEFSLAMFWQSYFVTALPGIAVHIVVVPLIVIALKKAKLAD